MERLTYYEEYAEKTVTELTITNMRTGLNLRKAEMMMNFAQGQPVESAGRKPHGVAACARAELLRGVRGAGSDAGGRRHLVLRSGRAGLAIALTGCVTLCPVRMGCGGTCQSLAA